MTHWITRATLSNLALLSLLAGFPAVAHAQTTTTQTTLSAAQARQTSGSATQLIQVASATGIAVGTELYIDQEAELVTAVSAGSTTTFVVQRGYNGTRSTSHTSGQIVYAGPTAGVTGSPFLQQDPSFGSCSSTALLYTVYVVEPSGELWQCVASTWVNVIDALEWVGPGNCAYSTSGGTLTTPTFGAAGNTALGLINASSAITPVYQVATTNSGTATNTITCAIPVPSRANIARGVFVADVTFFYGVQQTGLGTQAVVLASGTMNAQAVFTTITMPAAGTSETASTVTPVRWDSGTLTLLPTVANFNVATTTAGAFYSEKFTPATPMSMNTDLTGYYVNFTVLETATSASTVNTPGFLVHYRTVTGL